MAALLLGASTGMASCAAGAREPAAASLASTSYSLPAVGRAAHRAVSPACSASNQHRQQEGRHAAAAGALGSAHCPPARALSGSRLHSQRLRQAQAPGQVGTVSAAATGLADLQVRLPALGALGQRVAYQGVPGAYSEIAAGKACPDWDHAPCEQFELVFQSLSQWSADRAVLPIENSLGGSIHDVLDLLLRYRLHIVGETSVAVNHCLLANPGVQKGDLKRVISHIQALSQCDGYLRNMGGAVREAVSDTAGAAQTVARNNWRDVGAIASRRAAELYGLDILEEGIQDNKDNITRFIVLARDPLVVTQPVPGAYKTSVVFSLPEGPGQLWNALSVFALRNIDMTKVESRPMRSKPILVAKEGTNGGDALPRRFNFLFFVDFVGCTAETHVQNALKHLAETAPFVRVLGSYPLDREL